jgi:hypothetical protein
MSAAAFALRAAARAGLAAAVLAMAWGVPVAHAQSVEVSPLRVELAMNGGTSHTQAVTLTNQGSNAVRVRARLQDWFMAKDGTPQFDAAVPDTEREFAVASWVRVAPPEQIVEPGRQAIVRFTTSAPPGIADGGYRAAILFEFSPAAGDPIAQRRSVQFRSRIATLIYMNVGKLPPAIELIDLAARLTAGQPPAVVATLKNTGRANVRTRGTLTVRGEGGGVARTLDVPNVPLLPLADRDVTIALAREGEPPLPPGEYAVEVKIDVGMPALIVGETTLTIAR